jgi:hypothetical protein
VELADRVWVDTDAACGDGAATDVDDCLALALLARSPERRIAPISLLVGLEPERPGHVRAEGEVVYCPGVDPQLATWSMERLTSPVGRSMPRRGNRRPAGLGL